MKTWSHGSLEVPGGVEVPQGMGFKPTLRQALCAEFII